MKDNTWIRTFTGKKFYPLNPEPESIDIIDISHALSQICRFTGHSKYFYPVSQHCNYACNMAAFINKLAALLHDGSEAYLSDFSRPIKPYISNYKEIESKLESAIAKAFNFKYPYDPEVKIIDNRLLATELRDLMHGSEVEYEPYDWVVEPKTIKKTEEEFLINFYNNYKP